MTNIEQIENDTRTRVSIDKPINLAQLDEETGGHGLCSSDTEVVAVEGSSITEEELQLAINVHVAIFPLSPEEEIVAAVQALPDPATDLDGFKSGLIDLLTNQK